MPGSDLHKNHTEAGQESADLNLAAPLVALPLTSQLLLWALASLDWRDEECKWIIGHEGRKTQTKGLLRRNLEMFKYLLSAGLWEYNCGRQSSVTWLPPKYSGKGLGSAWESVRSFHWNKQGLRSWPVPDWTVRSQISQSLCVTLSKWPGLSDGPSLPGRSLLFGNYWIQLNKIR